MATGPLPLKVLRVSEVYR